MMRMARKKSKKGKRLSGPQLALPDHTKQTIAAVALFLIGGVLLLAGFNIAGPKGNDIYELFHYLLGLGYFLLPTLFFLLGANAMRAESSGITPLKSVVGVLFVTAGLGFIALVSPSNGGLVGASIANPLVQFFDIYVSLLILGGSMLITLIVLVEGGISTQTFKELWQILTYPFRKLLSREPREDDEDEEEYEDDEDEPRVMGAEEEDEEDYEEKVRAPEPARKPAPVAAQVDTKQANAARLAQLLGEYKAPPISILERDKGRPGVGDIKGNANIIKRTLANFGIVVELDEISIGPSVTRYAIKPAEGVKLQKIVGLQTNLELALAAHPVRIEAPIPGKSLVGIEVPNSSKVTVGLGNLLEAPEFKESSKPLMVALGRDIAGSSNFANVAKMPHGLIAGATGSGKSVTIHAIINSLLFRLGPSQLRFLMIDPKRVELTLYNPIPHLLSPVITDPKKAIQALRWAGKEMDRRYTLLEENRVRDIDSYHQNVLAPKLEELRKREPEEGEKVPEAMPYIVIIIDELADIMQTYPRELEAAIVRLAQMSRAVGIHLLLSTQRPSVNVITGLIKANVPARLALQVASQIDSRTILDQGGAEKLLGAGDMLYLSGDMGKPVRLQSAFISEAEVKKVVDFIAKNNEAELPIDIGAPAPGAAGSGSGPVGSFDGNLDDEEGEDDMYESARAAVIESGKASTSFLQRRLGLGYSRAARIMDMLEARGVIGPANGSKPRDILEKDYGGGQDGSEGTTVEE